MKRLSGWDAVLLYSETPTVHMHTLKLAVIEIGDLKGRTFGIDEFREVIRGRLYKLDPFRYQLVDIPLKMHHPMWRENCEVDLEYHVRPYRVDSPGGRRQLDEAVGRIASTPLDRSKPLWEMYFIEGLANGRIAVLGKIHHALADGVASANLLARGMDLQDGPQSEEASYATDPAPSTGELVRSAVADHIRHIGRLPGVMRYTAQGIGRVRKSSKKFSSELTRPFTPPPSFMNHRVDAQRRFATATLALADVKETAKHLKRHDQRHGARDLCRRTSQAVPEVRPSRRPSAVGFCPGEFRLLTRSHLRQLLHRRDDGGADRARGSVGAGAGRARRRGRCQGDPSPDGARTRQQMVGVLPARPGREALSLARRQGWPEQGAQHSDLQRAGPSRVRPGRRRVGDRDLLGRSADDRQRFEHHGVELRRPAEHLGAVRRRHACRTRTS